MSLEHLTVLESKEALKKKNGGISKGCRSQLEGNPTNQIWDNLAIKINDSNGLNPLDKIGIDVFIQ